MKYIYMLKGGDDCYKVGIAKDVRRRVSEIQTSNPHVIEVVTAKLVQNAEASEHAVHMYLAERKADGGREWFHLTSAQALDVCVLIHKYPDAITADEITTHELLKENRDLFERVNTKLDAIVDAAHIITRNDSDPMPTTKSIARGIQDDMLQEEAMRIFKSDGKASTSLLQRKLKIGYGRAARVMDDLEAAGLVSKRGDTNTARSLMSLSH